MGDWRDNPCFYVSVIDADRYAFLAGPFPTHGLALDLVDRCRKEAYEVDPKSWFYAYGTARYREEKKPLGILNGRIGYDEIIRGWEEENRRHQDWMKEELRLEKEAGACPR